MGKPDAQKARTEWRRVVTEEHAALREARRKNQEENVQTSWRENMTRLQVHT